VTGIREKPERSDKPRREKQERPERADRPEKGERREKPERDKRPQQRADKPNTANTAAETPPAKPEATAADDALQIVADSGVQDLL